jgi:hypothetical protein
LLYSRRCSHSLARPRILVEAAVGRDHSPAAAGSVRVTSTLTFRTRCRTGSAGRRPRACRTVEVPRSISDRWSPGVVERREPYACWGDGTLVHHVRCCPRAGTRSRCASPPASSARATDSMTPLWRRRPASLSMTWSRMVRAAEVKDVPSENPLPAGRWRLRIDTVRWEAAGPHRGRVLCGLAYLRPGTSGADQHVLRYPVAGARPLRTALKRLTVTAGVRQARQSVRPRRMEPNQANQCRH